MPAPHHFGYWVPDLAAAVERAARTLGIGPFLVHRHVVFDTFRMADGTEITDPAFFDHTAAFAAWGPVVLELGEVHSIDGSLAAAYGIGFDRIGHVSWVTEDLAAEGVRLEAAGCRPIHEAVTGAVHVAWYTGGTLFPHPIELHRAGPPILGLHDRLAAAARGWDGRDLSFSI
ncbi:VOC family protein [Actinoplanes sp. NPDC051411]|uniref:VOC family protein n=1 Tax=Actinoplanes sp. NPDC051411 TaxID=3155522 RepID=UPI0034490983